ncbi:hypothetical protein A3Q56_06768 [Intoshia linei]|uniref:Uncharacterized protein n=1 Tax=Intoshia linei TaxID=1819745 RepID=A0A177ATZ2_9BILA|nr:hypothetical protein A3Q56_06768 [Intoshia linei]
MTPISLLLTIYSRLKHSNQMIRIFAFTLIFASIFFPMSYRLWQCFSLVEIWPFATNLQFDQKCGSNKSLIMHILHFIFTIIATLFYGSRLPERYFHKFDIFGHSHQIFHVFISLATFFQLYATTIDARERFQLLINRNHIPIIVQLQNLMPFIVLLQIFMIIVAVYVYSILKKKKLE